MESIQLALTTLQEGFAILTVPTVLIFVAVGMLWGTLCGAAPGLGNGIALGVMISFTYVMEPITAVAFLVCISVGTAFGNGLPAVVLGIPGSSTAVLTAVEGYALTRRGKGPLAVATNWYAAVFGQLISVPFFLLMVVPLSAITWVFLSPEQFALYALGMAALVSMTGQNILKGMVAAAIGIAIGVIGPDPVSSVYRYDVIPEMRGGIPIIPAVLGLVTISGLLREMRQVFCWDDLAAGRTELRFPGFRKLRRSTRTVFTGAAIGTVVGSVPGLSGNAAQILAYNQAKLTSDQPELYGKGSLEGLATNESAGNASQAGEMVPTLGLGIPGSDSMVLLMGALMLQGFVPGPRLIEEAPELLHATAAGLLGGALFLLFLGWPLGKLMLRVTRLDRQVVLPIAFVITLVGVYSLRRSSFDVLVMLFFGVVGYFMIRYGFPILAAAVGLVLGPGFEQNLRLGLLLMDNDPIKFLSRPWTAGILALALLVLALGIRSTWREQKARRRSADEQQRDAESAGRP